VKAVTKNSIKHGHGPHHGEAQFERKHFRLPKQTLLQLDHIKNLIGAASHTETLKIAIGLLDWAATHLANGGHIAAVHDGKEVERVVLPGVSRSHNYNETSDHPHEH